MGRNRGRVTRCCHCATRRTALQSPFQLTGRRPPRSVRRMASMCDTCHAGCCRAYSLFITVFDALRIAKDLALPVGEFVSFVSKDEAALKALGQHSFRPLRFSDPGMEHAHCFVALKRVASALAPSTVKCFFLQEWKRAEPILSRESHPGSQIVGRCGIYASRPLMCRAFPATFVQGGSVAVIGNPVWPEVSQVNSAYALCPEKWKVDLSEESKTRIQHDLALHRYEMDFHNSIVDQWNKNPGATRDFFPYAISCYSKRLLEVPSSGSSS